MEAETLILQTHFPNLPRFPMDDNSASAGDRPPVSSLKDLKGMFLSEALNQHGCKFLHQKLEERKPEDIQMIFTELKGYIGMLMFNEFGNFVIQKLFHVCDEEQMNQMVFSIAADLKLLMCLCLDFRGSRPMMEFVQCLSTRKQLSTLISAFKKIMVDLVTHPIGCCIIGHFYEFFDLPAKEAEQIVGVIADHFFEIATNESGSRLMQFLISGVCKLFAQERLLAGIRVYLFDLCIDQFGNHVVQHVIGLGMQNMNRFMVSELRGGFALLSRNKYGSNVVNKLIEASKETYAPEIINEIISSPDLSWVLQNPYSYSVVQSAKEYTTGTVRETLDHLVLGHSDC